MAFRACFALVVVLYLAVLLVQVEVSVANNATVAENGTEAETNATTTPKPEVVGTTVAATTAEPKTNETATTKPTSGAEGMFSILPFAVYGLCSTLVAMM